MKEELEKELLNSLETVKEYVSKTAEFASEQAPLVIEELVRFSLWFSGLQLLICLILLFFIIKLFRLTVYYSEEGDESCFFTGIAGGALSMFSLLVFIKNAKVLIMCLIAPRLFVVEYLGGMM